MKPPKPDVTPDGPTGHTCAGCGLPLTRKTQVAVRRITPSGSRIVFYHAKHLGKE